MKIKNWLQIIMVKKEIVEVISNPVITEKYYHNENNKNSITLITVGRLSKKKIRL